jgi:DNA-binding winged helix-turn-helix (wHTH) protein/Tol biopolymer transport system component
MNQESDALSSGTSVEYLFGPFRLDVASLQLWRGDEVVAVTPKAFDTLLVLIRHRARLVRKDELMSAVWGDSFVSEDSLTQNITALRRALGDDPHQPHYITTVPRRGYRFTSPVTERSLSDPTAAPVQSCAGARARGSESNVATAVSEAVTRAPARRPMWRAARDAGRLAAVVISPSVLEDDSAQVNPLWVRFAFRSRLRRIRSSRRVARSRPTAAIWPSSPKTIRRASRVCGCEILNNGDAKPIEGTEGANKPFWSPDGEFVGFFSAGRIKRVSANGGPVQMLASTVGLTVSGGTWGADGTILFANYRSGITAIPASGGEATPITTLDASARETAHRWPQFLPDGRHFVFSIYAEDAARAGTYIAEIGSQDRVRIIDIPGGIFAPPDFVLYVRDRVLMAQPFNVQSMRVTGDPVSVASDVYPPGPTGTAAISASAGGLLAFGGRSAETRLVWFNRAGQPLGSIKAPTPLHNPSLSPDERYLLAGSGTDVWLVDLERGATTRVVPGNTPLLSPDAAQIAFTSGRIEGVSDVYVRSTSGSAEDQLLLSSKENKIVNDWSKDGRYLVYASTNAATKMDLWMMQTTGDRRPTPLLVTPFNEFQAQISPDGHWIAYASDESGTWEVYVQSFPVLGAKRAVSTGGGSEPQWRPDGRELFYLTADGTLMSVEVRSGEALQVSRPTALFRTSVPISGEMNTRRNHYAATRDGQRFLVSSASEAQSAITVLVNWPAGLTR